MLKQVDGSSFSTTMFYYERRAKREGFRFIAGVDEAGRGPLAGPVVASAVVLRSSRFKNRIDDSKRLTTLQREKAFFEIRKNALGVGVGIIDHQRIDERNILIATHLAMKRAVISLIARLKRQMVWLRGKSGQEKIYLLIDGKIDLKMPYKFKSILEGDTKSISIACASIIAKVSRDRIMDNYHRIYPQYCFSQNKGYATEAHIQALKKFGPSPIHRKSFKYEGKD